MIVRPLLEDTKSLDLIVRVARLGSLTKAANQMGLTVATASKMVGRMEKQLGVQLFNRTTRAISLTERGRIFVDKATRALAELDEAIDLLRQDSGTVSGTVRAMVSSTIGKNVMLRFLPEFWERFPDITLDLYFHDGSDDIVEENFDLSVNDRASVNAGYTTVLLFRSALILAASPEYLRRRGPIQSLEDLGRHDFINVRIAAGHLSSPPNMEGDTIEWNLRKRATKDAQIFRFLPSGRLSIMGQFDAILQAGVEGLGIFSGYTNILRPYLESGTLKVVLPAYEVSPADPRTFGFHIRYPHRRFVPAAVRTFIEFLQEKFHHDEDADLDLESYAAI